MPYGYAGKIVKVNLTTENVEIKKFDENFYRKYLGGRALALYFLLKELKKDVDPFSPKNKLIFATGVATGIPLPGMNRYCVAAKSPLTNTFGESYAGGFFGPELKFAGFDALVIEGKAEKPIYLWIHDNEIEIKNATHIWGQKTKETTETICKEIGEPRARVAAIGPAGEKLVRFANILHNMKYANGRCGLGAVMGSKNLKAIAVKGGQRLKFADREKIVKLAKWAAKAIKDMPGPRSRRKYGTAVILLSLNELGLLPTRNFLDGKFEHAEEISGEKMAETILVSKKGCYGCAIMCKRVVKGKYPYETDPEYGGPEYETLAALGSLCGVNDLNAISYANMLCNAYGLDTISTGVTIAFAMECFENKILTKKDFNGLEPKFGNTNAMVKLVEMIAKREGIGDILAEGVMRASRKIGRGAEKFAMHVKGKEVPMHEPRGKKSLALAYATSPCGADHMQNAHDTLFESDVEKILPLGILKPLSATDLSPEKVRMFTYLNMWWSLFDCLGVCKFAVAPHPAAVFDVSQLRDIIKAATGWDLTVWEMLKVGERAITMARCFNVREGFTKDDDTLPERFFKPFRSNIGVDAKITKQEFENSLKLFYGMMGWNPDTGVPTEAKLYELDVGWIANFSAR
ncbi:MAG: aldehyde ferredoxin oxidoreductase family protein [Candidatus Baldrarchaeia archaeon]